MDLDRLDEVTELVRSTASDVKTFRARFEDRLEDVEVQMRRLEHERHLPVSGYQPSDEEPTASLPRSPHNLPRSPRPLPGEGDIRAGLWLREQLTLAAVDSSAGAGAALTPPEYSTVFFDLLASASVAIRSGIRIMRTERDSVQIPRLTGDPAAAWTAELAPITEDDPTADVLTATPRKIACLTALSNEVADDSDPAALATFGTQIVRSLSLGFDLGVFEGSGTPPEITGFANVTGKKVVDMSDAAFADLDPFATAITMIEEANSEADSIVLHPTVWGQLLQLKELASGSNKPLLSQSAGSPGQGITRTIFGLPVYLSSQVSDTAAYVYPSSEIVAVIRRDPEVQRDSSRLFNQDASELRGVMRADVVFPHPEALVLITNIGTA